MDVLKRLNQLLDERGWTGYRLMKESGLSASTISNIFCRHSVPSIRTLSKICDAMGITLAQFFSEGKEISLSDEQYELLALWARIKPEQRKYLMELMNTMYKE